MAKRVYYVEIEKKKHWIKPIIERTYYYDKPKVTSDKYATYVDYGKTRGKIIKNPYTNKYIAIVYDYKTGGLNDRRETVDTLREAERFLGVSKKINVNKVINPQVIMKNK